MYKYSNAFVVSEQIYLKNNMQFKFCYSTSSGVLLKLPIEDANKIQDGIVPEINSPLLKMLVKAEVLIQENQNDLDIVVSRIKKNLDDSVTANFVILPTAYCNMGCSYCGQSHQAGRLTSSFSDKVVSRIKSAVDEDRIKKVSVCWFGGEPMVGYQHILKISAEVIQYANHCSVAYSGKMVTNGSLLTLEKLHVLHEACRINTFAITLDGPEEIHNKRRILKKGGDSFQQITTLIQNSLKEPKLKNIRYILRTNIDIENAEYIDEYLDRMHALGFCNNKNIVFELTGVYSWSNDVSSVELKKQAFADLEAGWMLKMTELKLQYPYLFTSKDWVCVAVDPWSEVISSSGKTFSCTEHVLVPQHERDEFISTLSEVRSGPRSLHRYNEFYEQLKSHKVPCGKCKFLGICGGACPKQWEEGNIPCPSIKYNIQQRLDIAAINSGFSLHSY